MRGNRGKNRGRKQTTADETSEEEDRERRREESDRKRRPVKERQEKQGGSRRPWPQGKCATDAQCVSVFSRLFSGTQWHSAHRIFDTSTPDSSPWRPTFKSASLYTHREGDQLDMMSVLCVGNDRTMCDIMIEINCTWIHMLSGPSHAPRPTLGPASSPPPSSSYQKLQWTFEHWGHSLWRYERNAAAIKASTWTAATLLYLLPESCRGKFRSDVDEAGLLLLLLLQIFVTENIFSDQLCDKSNI